jgi:hypothetical protein
MPAPKTYSNTCLLKTDGAEFLYEGKCKDTTLLCPEVIVPKVKDGCTLTPYTDDQ